MLDIKSKGPGFDPHPGHGDFLRVRDKTWGYQDSNKSSQVIGISVLLLIIRKTWAYQLRHDQSFARLGLTKIPINHSQDFSISRLQSIVHKTWAYQGFHILHNPDTSCSIIFKTLAYPDSNQSFAKHWHIHTPIYHFQDLGLSRL